MPHYILQGRVLPERANLTTQLATIPRIFENGEEWEFTLSILMNQVVVSVKTDTEQQPYTLRNLVHEITQSTLSVIGFTIGNAYELEITRVFTPDLTLDLVYSIQIDVISQRATSRDARLTAENIFLCTLGHGGHLLERAFTDLNLAMKHAVDTAFYCYRALEAFRLHCAIKNNLVTSDKKDQWVKFRETTSATEEDIKIVRLPANATRHGDRISITEERRIGIFNATWQIAEAYLLYLIINLEDL